MVPDAAGCYYQESASRLSTKDKILQSGSKEENQGALACKSVSEVVLDVNKGQGDVSMVLASISQMACSNDQSEP